MKHAKIVLSSLFVLILTFPIHLTATPVHPIVLERIRSGEIDLPYAFEHSVELHLMGVDATSGINLASNLDQVNFNLLVLLVDFNDQVSQVTANSYDNLFFGGTTGTVNDYYSEISYSQLQIQTQNPPSTTGWFRMPQNYSYYVNNANGFGTYPMNAQRMVEDAVAAADATVNFANYDHNGDGAVDGLVVLHSGTGGEWSGTSTDMWSHAWGVPQPFQTNDGVVVTNYCTVPEFWQTPGDMTIGVIVHELAHHIFGLPDLYDIDYSSLGIGSWSLMSYGSWNGPNGMGSSPAHPDAWSRAQLGFLPPTNVFQDILGFPLAPIENLPDLFRAWTQGQYGQEYYLVENRFSFGYDAFLPGFGVLIWHIDDSVTGWNQNEWFPGNMGAGHYLVALEQADGNWDLEQNVNFGDGADPYPGWQQNLFFDVSSIPSSWDYAGNPTQVSIGNFVNTPPNYNTDMLVGIPASNPPASVLINPASTPIWIPAGGGSFSFSIIINNTLPQQVSGHLWLEAILPNNNMFPIQLIGVTLQPGVPLTFPGLIQSVPGWAPAGSYQYICNIGGFPNFIVDTDHLPFAKQPLSPDGSEIVGQWNLAGLEHQDMPVQAEAEKSRTSQLPTEFKVAQVYPNPFNARVTATIDLPYSTNLKVSVYNTLGQQVLDVANRPFPAGRYGFTLEASELGTGMYFLQVSNGQQSVTEKLVIMK